jgi:hypothetical protein
VGSTPSARIFPSGIFPKFNVFGMGAYMRNVIKLSVVLLIIAVNCSAADAPDNWRIQPLAHDYKILYQSPDSNEIYLYDPGITVCPNGRIVATFSLGGPDKNKIKPQTGRAFVYTSDDDGSTWQRRTNFPMSHFRPFVAGDKLYILGHSGNLRVISSGDWGDTWSDFSELTQNQEWHGSATNVWYKNNFVYLVMERRVEGQMKDGWRVAELAPVLLRGDINKDLTKRENWTFASEMVFHDVVNDKQLNLFGIPFFSGFYPNVARNIRNSSSFHPIGWLESNVVQITDPNHYWYDPSSRTFHIFMRAHTGLTNIGCMIKAVEQPDGTIKTMFQTAPSGKKHLYLPLPGGQMKFCVVYDAQTKLYWLLSTQSTDSMTKLEKLPDDRYCLSDNERRRLVLHFSKNMVDWCFAGLVDMGSVEKASRHYANMVIKGDDLLILSRSGDENAKDAHNGNMVTFHRVKNFRKLVY